MFVDIKLLLKAHFFIFFFNETFLRARDDVIQNKCSAAASTGVFDKLRHGTVMERRLGQGFKVNALIFFLLFRCAECFRIVAGRPSHLCLLSAAAVCCVWTRRTVFIFILYKYDTKEKLGPALLSFEPNETVTKKSFKNAYSITLALNR